MPKYINKTTINLCSAVGVVLCVLFVIYGLQHQLFTSQDALRQFVGAWGVMGIAAFIFFQAVQVVIPILPGGWAAWQA